MASYRVTLTIGRLAPGVDPESVLPTAAGAAARTVVVEAQDVAVVRGQARLTVRFGADDDHGAALVADDVAAETTRVAEVLAAALTRRDGSRWSRLPY